MPNSRDLLKIFGLAFLLNAVWEHAHLLLYTCADKPYREIALMMWQATAGDALITIFIFVLCALIWRDRRWFRPTRLWLPVLLGALIAIGIEYHALFIAERWAYNAWMPTVFGIGLTPVLQLMILPGAVYYWLSCRAELLVKGNAII